MTRPFPDSGVGSNLASLAGATWLARELGRTLVVDWRGLDVLADKSLNYFSEFFEPVPELAGVPVLYAPDGVPETEPVWIAPRDVEAALADPRSAETYLALQPYHGLDRIHPSGAPLDRDRVVAEVYAAVRPNAEIRAQIDRFAAEHLQDRFVVGLNVRTAAGAEFRRGGQWHGRVDERLFKNRSKFVRGVLSACEERVQGLPPHVRSRRRIFFATTSPAMRELLADLPGAVGRRTMFAPPNLPPEGEAAAHGYTDRDSIVDTIADMFLLARCDALVYNFSYFNYLPQVVTGYFGGNLVNIEEFWNRSWPRRRKAELRAALRPKTRLRGLRSRLRA